MLRQVISYYFCNLLPRSSHPPGWPVQVARSLPPGVHIKVEVEAPRGEEAVALKTKEHVAGRRECHGHHTCAVIAPGMGGRDLASMP